MKYIHKYAYTYLNILCRNFLDDCLIVCALYVFVMFFIVFERMIDMLGAFYILSAYFTCWVLVLYVGCLFFVVGFFFYISLFFINKSRSSLKHFFYLCIWSVLGSPPCVCPLLRKPVRLRGLGFEVLEFCVFWFWNFWGFKILGL